jgi:hypothetical protein
MFIYTHLCALTDPAQMVSQVPYRGA